MRFEKGVDVDIVGRVVVVGDVKVRSRVWEDKACIRQRGCGGGRGNVVPGSWGCGCVLGYGGCHN